MFTEKQLSRYADVLLWGLQTARNRKPAKNDLVLLRFDLAAVRLAEILYAKMENLRIKGTPASSFRILK